MVITFCVKMLREIPGLSGQRKHGHKISIYMLCSPQGIKTDSTRSWVLTDKFPGDFLTFNQFLPPFLACPPPNIFFTTNNN